MARTRSPKNILKITGLAIGTAIGVLLITGIAAAIYLDSASGHRWIMDKINSDSVHIEGLDGSIFGDLTLIGIEVHDTDGAWMQIPNVHMKWRPLALLGGKLHVIHLEVPTITVNRQPLSAKSGEAPDATGGLPEPPLDFHIERLSVGEVTLAEPVIGFSAILTLKAAAQYEEGSAALLDLDIRRTDVVSDRATARISLDAASRDFDLDMDFESPKGGLISEVLGFDHQTTATLNGEGSLDLWRGNLSGQVDGENILNASVILKDSTLSLNGTALPPAFLASDVPRFTGPSVPLSLAIEFSTPCDGCAAIQARIQPRAADISLDGTLDLEDFSLPAPAQFRIIANDLDLIKDYIDPVSLTALEATGTISGTFSEPVIKTSFTATNVSREGFTAETLSADLTATLSQGPILFDIDGRVVGPELEQSPELTALLGQTIKIAASGSWDMEGETLAVKNLIVSADTLSLNTQGDLNMAGATDLTFRATLPSLEPLSEIAAMPLAGSVTLEGTVTASDRSAPYQLALTTLVKDFNTNDAMINGLAGPAPILEAVITFGRDGAISVTALDILAKAATATMTGQYGGMDGTLAAEYEVTINDLTPLTGDGGLTLDGGLTVSGAITGTMDQINATAESQFSDLTLQSVKFSNVHSKLEVSDITTRIHGVFTLNGDSTLGPLRLALGLEQNAAGHLLIQDIDGAIGPAILTGNLALPLGKPVTGSIVIETTELDQADGNPALAGLGGTVNLIVNLGNDNNRQKIDFTAEADSLQAVLNETDLLSAESFNAAGTIITGDGDPTVDIQINGEGIGYRFITFETLTARAENNNGVIHFMIAPKGRAGAPFDLAMAGQMQNTEDGQIIEITLNGTVDEEALTTQNPIIYQSNATGLKIQPATILLGDGSLTLEVQRQTDGLTRASVGLENTDLSLIAAFVPVWPIVAIANGDVHFDARPGSFPTAAFQLRAENLRPTFRSDNDQWADLQITGNLAGNRLKASGTLTADNTMTANFSAEAPLVIDGETLTADVPADGAVAASLTWRGQVAPIWDLLDMPDHLVEGDLSLDLAVSGTVVSPNVTGSLSFGPARYEYFEAGLILADLNISAVIDGRRFTVHEASATDGDRGRISLTGWLDALPEKRFPAELNLAITDALLIRRTEARIRASADLVYKREAATSLLSGSVDIDRAEIRLLDRLPPSVVKIDVVEINGPEAEIAEATTVEPRQRELLSLDLRITAPQEIFVRGKGIDSEWGGALEITGLAPEPVLNGSLNVLRGSFEFIGRRFDLQTGEVTFNGAREIDPGLNILANYSKQGFSADLRVGGKASLPTITLTSTPPLPQDEIISRILFGTTATSLSPIEAVQLAGVIASLASGEDGGSFDPVTMARRTLGIDRLSIENSSHDGRGTTIAGGKYLTNNIYLEVDTVSGTGETTARIEAELTRTLSLETKMNSRRDSSLAIRWSWNY